MRVRGRSRAGYTLVEVMVTAAVAGIAMAGVFAFARFQMLSYATQGDVSRMQVAARTVFDGIAVDLRGVGYGTSFYAGAQASALGGTIAVIAGGSNRGIPSLRMANNINMTGVMPNSDALMVIRPLGNSATLSTLGPGNTTIPGVFDTTTEFQVEDLTPLIGCQASGGLVLVSDLARRLEPVSMLLALDAFPRAPVGVSPDPGPIRFASLYGLDPSDVSRTNGATPDVSPQGVGPGSLITCVQLVTYWVDDQARLRMWQSTPAGLGGGLTTLAGTPNTFTVPVNPAIDVVLTEGIENLQVAAFLSQEGTGASNGWVFDGVAQPASVQDFAETRAIRLSAIVRTVRADKTQPTLSLPPALEDLNLSLLTPLHGCTNPSSCYDPSYRRKIVTFESEIRNMRIFDMLSSDARTNDDIRSYPL